MVLAAKAGTAREAAKARARAKVVSFFMVISPFHFLLNPEGQFRFGAVERRFPPVQAEAGVAQGGSGVGARVQGPGEGDGDGGLAGLYEV